MKIALCDNIFVFELIFTEIEKSSCKTHKSDKFKCEFSGERNDGWYPITDLIKCNIVEKSRDKKSIKN